MTSSMPPLRRSSRRRALANISNREDMRERDKPSEESDTAPLRDDVLEVVFGHMMKEKAMIGVAAQVCRAWRKCISRARAAKRCFTVDDRNARNPQLAPRGIIQDVHLSLREAEKRLILRKSYIETGQPELTARMRGILVDWLIEIHESFKLVEETLFLAVQLCACQRFVSRRPAPSALHSVGPRPFT